MNESEQLDKMSDGELVAYWNVLQMGQRMIQDAEAKNKTERHLPIVSELLAERNIPHEQGKLLQKG